MARLQSFWVCSGVFISVASGLGFVQGLYKSLYGICVCVCVCVFVCLCVHLWVVIKVFMRVLQYFGRVKGSAFRTLRVQSCRVWGFGSLGFAWLRVAGFGFMLLSGS